MKRETGILLHITSLSSPYGIGDLGPEAYRFADFLSKTKQSLWQVLPFNPTNPAHGNSPYSCVSAFAANSLLVSPELLVKDGFLSEKDLQPLPAFPTEKVNYLKAIAYKERLLNIACQRFKGMGDRNEYEKFCSENSHWLEDFTLFIAIKSFFGGKVWGEWPKELRDREPESLKAIAKKLQNEIEREKFTQYLFFKQWFKLKSCCNQNGIRIIGDIPIYVNYDSADVWVNPEIFKLNEEKRPVFVAGVPPDYFSETGQLWGNPIYNWDILKERNYEWWIQRMEHALKIYDVVRIDHFRGLVDFWEVPAGEQTAVNGKWVDAPAEDFFSLLLNIFPNLPIIAEDLGFLSPRVKEVMQIFGFPGMKVLLFAFGEDNPTHPYLPYTYEKNSVVYTGTHDNNTARGWFEKEATPEEKERVLRYLGHKIPSKNIHWELIQLAMMSVANTALFPMQDILGLGQEARMNQPSSAEKNWEWRMLPEQLTSAPAEKLLELTETYGRAVREQG